MQDCHGGRLPVHRDPASSPRDRRDETWATRVSGAPFNVSWVGNRHVAFEWESVTGPRRRDRRPGYRLLDLTGPGRNLLAVPRDRVPAAEPTQFVPSALVTPDGNAVITSTVQNIPDGPGRDTVVVARSSSWPRAPASSCGCCTP